MNHIQTVYKMRLGIDPVAASLLRRLQGLNYSVISLAIESVMRVEGVGDVHALLPFFTHPMVEVPSVATSLTSTTAQVREVAYRRAMTDPELASLRRTAQALGLPEFTWARWATRYAFEGVSHGVADEIVKRYCMNSQTQEILAPDFAYDTLVPQGEVGGVEHIAVASMDDQELAALSSKRRLMMSAAKLAVVRAYYVALGRPARDAELEVVAAKWSDHCNHETWRALGLLPFLFDVTNRLHHRLVLSAFEDNAGVMRFYGRYGVNVKGETHISPTFAGDPYGGIMTKHGGVQRDIMLTALGAYPILGTTVMATCDPHLPWNLVVPGGTHPQVVLTESVRGTADYCNPMGIPMAWSQYLKHDRNWKGIALGHCVGILPAKCAKKGTPMPGDFVVLIGGLTGNDGLHGATVSSAAATAKTVTIDAAHVQIGMPIEQRGFMEAIPVLRDAGCIRASTDCGAAGLSSACFEMGEDTGVWLNLAWVPRKCAAMRPWQILLSESQERGVLAIPPSMLPEALAILRDYDVRFAVIGVFTDTGRAQAVYDSGLSELEWVGAPTTELIGDVAVDLPYDFLNAAPLPEIAVREPTVRPHRFQPSEPASEDDWIQLVRAHLGHYNIADQSSAAHHFDQTVQGRTVLPYIIRGNRVGECVPEELYVSGPVYGKPWGLGVAVATNQYYGEVDPAGLGQLITAQAVTRLVSAGFGPDDIVLNVNVMSPPVMDNPGHAWRLKQLVECGYGYASQMLRTPVISGKDSSSCRLGECDAPLGLSVLALGRMRDTSRLVPKLFTRPGDTIILYHPGLLDVQLGGSVFLDRYGERSHVLPYVDLKQLRRGLCRVHRMFKECGWNEGVHSRSVVAEGGLIRRLFEMSYGSGFGCAIDLPWDPLKSLFAELNAAMILVVDPASPWERYLARGDYVPLGVVTEEPEIAVHVEGERLFKVLPDAIATEWKRTFAEVVE